MKTIELETFTPKEKLPKPSTPMKLHPVLAYTSPHRGMKRSWYRCIYLGGLLNEWRIEGTNTDVKVVRWAEIPKGNPK